MKMVNWEKAPNQGGHGYAYGASLMISQQGDMRGGVTQRGFFVRPAVRFCIFADSTDPAPGTSR